MKIFTNEQLRYIDKATIEKDGITSLELVERAATAISCEIISRWKPTHRVYVFAGPGNNGADALAVARLLSEQGYRIDVFLFNVGGDRLSKDCRANKERLEGLDSVRFTEVVNDFVPPALTSRDLVIDGLFGSGLRSVLEGGFQSLVNYINESGAAIVSIDIPSGMFSEWNEGVLNRGVVHANLTLTMQSPRLSFFIADNAPMVGEWKALDIELRTHEVPFKQVQYVYVEKADVKRMLVKRSEFSSKADFGSGLLVSGSYGMMGAAILAARGALRSGIGKLTIHSPRCGFTCLQSAVPEALYENDRDDIAITDMSPAHGYNVVAIGPGIGTHDLTVEALGVFLKSWNKPVVLDADALNCIAKQPSLLDHLPVLSVITPHAGEFDRLFGEHQSHEARLRKAMDVARYYQIMIVMKGRYTAIVRPDGKIYFNSSGNSAMATAGSGDVLTGVIMSLMAQGYNPDVAACIGVFVHGYAGDLAAIEHGQYGVVAQDIAANIGKAIRDIMM